MKKKTLPQKISAFFRKWLSAKIIPHMVLKVGEYFFTAFAVIT